ncbi:MAG: PadR family transcriptional regulator [Aeromicrobium sp.]|jgi:DNA-binding PadR family transcriptional regulator|nr:PadR family transcriptional regulator [Aeromicrobium sp.]
MALQHAILVSLAERSATGYDLARRFDASIGHFWKASHQQIYKVLGRMESDGTVACEVVAQEGRPHKKVYGLTESGREELAAWTSKATPVEHLRSEFAVKLRALPFGDGDAIVDDVRVRRRAHQAQLAYYTESAATYFPRPDELAPEDVGRWLVLRGGILIEQAGLAWCDEILQRLAPDEDER